MIDVLPSSLYTRTHIIIFKQDNTKAAKHAIARAILYMFYDDAQHVNDPNPRPNVLANPPVAGSIPSCFITNDMNRASMDLISSLKRRLSALSNGEDVVSVHVIMDKG